jgi:hypothetical protein
MTSLARPASTVAAKSTPAFADAVLMVRPAAFGPNSETAATNRFQASGARDPRIVAAAQAEFEGLVAALDAAGIEVMVAGDSAEPEKPDAVFPNNWFTTHADGTLVLYPMLAPSRRLERRAELVIALAERNGRRVSAVVDLSPWEGQGLALEGTGSMVLDRARRIAYVCLSPRTAPAPLAQWARLMDYEAEAFHAAGPNGVAIYHTNVMMALGQGFAAVALEAITDPGERRRIRESLEESGREVLPLTPEQIAGFAGNLLQLEGARGPIVAMSENARRSLGAALIARLERHGTIIAAPIPTIERYGGGSVRCTLAEMFLPQEA